jgi:pyruvate/2-oxoglutarate dehydrogenase complex dihydrolipoamide dehydrogenase (E3) component
VEIREGAKVARVEPMDPAGRSGVVAVLGDGTRVAGTHLLLAVGRAPRLAGLDLPAAGVQASPRGVAVRPDLRSVSNGRIWAVGDIADPAGIGPRAFTHVASYHAGIVVRSMLFRLPARVDYAALPRVTYTDPELAQVGLTEVEAREAGYTDVQVLRQPLAENDRAIAEGRPEGVAKLVVASRTGRLLGAGLLGPRAGEMAGLYGLMIGRKLPLSALATMILPYPTLSEAGKRAAGEFYAPRLLSPFTKRLIGWLKRLP